MKPICVPCQRFFRPVKNGRSFIEGMPSENGAPAGLAAPEKWRPYKLWVGDEWGCPDCGARIIVGTGLNPVSEHYLPEFSEEVERFAPSLMVRDC